MFSQSLGAKKIMFETICLLAQEQKKEALAEIVESSACINIRCDNDTPVMVLAKGKGNADAVWMLINKFRASRKDAIKGFAFAGNKKQVKRILTQEHVPGNLHELNKEAIRGFAQGNHVKQVTALLLQEHIPPYYDELIRAAILGFIDAENFKQVKVLLTPEYNLGCPLKFQELRAFSYARMGCTDEVRLILAQKHDLKKLSILETKVFDGFVEAGNLGQVLERIDHEIDLKSRKFLRLTTIGHFARMGNIEGTIQIISRAVKESEHTRLLGETICHLARIGHVPQVMHILAQYPLHQLREKAIEGLAPSWCVDEVNKILLQENDLTRLHELKKMAIRSFAVGGHVKQVMAILTQEHDLDRWHQLRQEAIGGFAIIAYVEQVNKIFIQENDAKRLGELRKSAEIGFVISGHSRDPETLLRLYSYLDDDALRDQPIYRTEMVGNQILPVKDNELLQAKAAKYNLLLKQLDYSQVQDYFYVWMLPKEAHSWFLEGIQLIDKPLPLELFVYITSFIIGKSDADTQRIFSSYFAITPEMFYQASCLLKSDTDFLEDKERYQRRLAFRNERIKFHDDTIKVFEKTISTRIGLFANNLSSKAVLSVEREVETSHRETADTKALLPITNNKRQRG